MSSPASADAFPRSHARRWRLAGVMALVATMVAPALVWAAGGGHGDHHHAPSITDLFFPAINFSIYLAIVIIYVIPAIRQYLSQRHQQIVESANEAKKALTDAEQAEAEAKQRLAGIDAECTSLRNDLVEAATQQSKRAREDAEANGQRRLKDAGLLAEQERRRALGNVRAEIAALASSLAEERIRKALGPDDQRTFVRQFLEEAARQ